MRPWRRATPADPFAAPAGGFALERCPACGTARTVLPRGGREPPPEKLYRAGAYSPARRRADLVIEPLRSLAERDKLRHLAHATEGERVLEVGAGDGRFVAAMRARGLDARGIEPVSGEASGRGEAVVERLRLEDAELGQASLDGVVLWHVLEHLEDPAAALAKLAGALREGGWLVVAAPNLDSAQARIGGDRWFHQDVPRHRTHFTARGLRTLCERQRLQVRSTDHWVLEQNPLGMWLTLLNLVTRERNAAFRLTRRGQRVGARDLIALALAGPPLVPVAFLTELLAAAAGRGATVVMRARR
jgi:2-polyprenyl-3-methyl-5-hydroxy-6-metoxy-1,4-benzoquinol methylase